MPSNRKIKTDGNLEIESSQVDINSNIDVTGDVGCTTNTVTNNATIGGTLGVTGQATLSGLAYPTSDGSADQVLKTDGNGALSFTTVASGGGGGVDTITSASEAASYSGTNRIIYITANEHVTFTVNLSNRLIFQSVFGKNVTFQGHVDSCVIHCLGNIIVENTSDNEITDVDFHDNTAKSYNFTLDNSGNTEGNTINIERNNIHVGNIFKATENSEEGYNFQINKVVAEIFEGGGSSQKLQIKASSIECDTVRGKIDIPSGFGSVLTVFKGSVLASTQIDIAGVTYVSGVFSFPIKVDSSGVQASVVAIANQNSAQSIPNNSTTIIEYDNEDFDNTSSYTHTGTSAGTFTAPVKGVYSVSAQIVFANSNNFDVDETSVAGVYVNNVQKLGSIPWESVVSNSQNVYAGNAISGLIQLDQGDTVVVKVTQKSGGALSLFTNATYNYLTINKII